MLKPTMFSFSLPPNYMTRFSPDFIIHVGPKDYECHISYLSAFSPMINRLILCDRTIFEINYPDEDKNLFFQDLIGYIYGQKLAINNLNINFFTKAAIFFENSNLLEVVSNFHIQEDEFYIFNSLHNQFPIQYTENEINYIAEHFKELMNEESMLNLSLFQYDAIFSSTEFSFPDEKALFQWITKLIQIRGTDFISLYSHVLIDRLSLAEVQQFVQMVPADKIEGSLWHVFSSRLTKPLNEESNNGDKGPRLMVCADSLEYTDKVVDVPPELRILSQHFPYLQGGHYNGIFSYISRDRNPQHRGYITMDCGGIKRRFLCVLVGNYNESGLRWDNFAGKKVNRSLEKDQWFTIEFLIYKVRLEYYTLSCPEDKPDKSQPKSWKLLGSNDGNSWTLIHQMTDCKKMNTRKPTMVFKCSQSTEFYTHFKFVQLENHSKSPESKYEFTLNHIEFFGEVQKL